MKTRKLRHKKKRNTLSCQKKKKRGGGNLINTDDPFPILAQFEISDANINSFRRHIKSPTDCVISAFQIIGVLDNNCAQFMRTVMFDRLFRKRDVENIAILRYGFNFDFKLDTDYNKFAQYIHTYLKPKHVIFAGYSPKVPGAPSHVFLIGRYENGTIVLIDPQVNPNTICDLDNDTECRQKLSGQNNYFLLHHSINKLSDAEIVIKNAYDNDYDL